MAALAAAFLLLSAGGFAGERAPGGTQPFDVWIPHPLFSTTVDLGARAWHSRTATNATNAELAAQAYAYPERTQLNTSGNQPAARREVQADLWTAAPSESRSIWRFCSWRAAPREISSAARGWEAPQQRSGPLSPFQQFLPRLAATGAVSVGGERDSAKRFGSGGRTRGRCSAPTRFSRHGAVGRQCGGTCCGGTCCGGGSCTAAGRGSQHEPVGWARH